MIIAGIQSLRQWLFSAIIALAAISLSGPSSAELLKGTHLVSFAKIEQCFNKKKESGLARNRIYRSGEDNYFVYLKGKQGVVFQNPVKRQSEKFDGGEYDMRIDGEHIYLFSDHKEKMRHLKRPLRFRTKTVFWVAEGKCKIVSCEIKIKGAPNYCGSTCHHSECEVREGPVSPE
jgi:hypothetical protein